MKRYVILLALLGMIWASNAAPVSCDEASAIAASFLNQRSVTEVKTPFEHMYVFNGTSGFVILSADDCVIPVLGYSLEQPFETDLSEGIRGWLRAYDEEIQAVMEVGLEAADEVRTAWSLLRSSGCLPACNRSEVYPLVYTRWNQRSPYNMYCPGESVTGCVAIVMAQLMKYWECPIRGTGSHSYVHDTYGTLSANFGATEYDWNHMPAKLTEASYTADKEAVATLIYHCGVSVDMKYSPDGSSTPASKVVEAMPQYFSYASSMSQVYQRDYTDNQWKQLLKDELDALRPMFYAGQSRGAHAFICDGYDASDLFHINWGWGGNHDGYYAIGALNPGTNGPFNELNYAIIGIQPADGGWPAIPAPVALEVYPSDYDVVLEWWMPVDNPSYTYKVSRNGTLIASGLTEPAYVDHDLPSGTYNYQVWAVSNGVESNKKASFEIELARIEVVSADPSRGTVWGGRLEEFEVGLVVKAYPNPGYFFLCWMEDDQVVSTQSEYFIVVDGDHHLTAYFSATGVDEDDDLPLIRKIEVFSVNGVKLETINDDFDNWERRLDGYAKGVYLLRVTTDKGIMTKKMIR